MRRIQNIAFFVLLVVDVFSFCYLVISPVGTLLVKGAILSCEGAQILVAGVSILLTTGLVSRLITYLKSQD